jgi:hypothetical protein
MKLLPAWVLIYRICSCRLLSGLQPHEVPVAQRSVRGGLESCDEEGLDLSGFFARCEKARYTIDPYGSLNTSRIAARNPSKKPGPLPEK